MSRIPHHPQLKLHMLRGELESRRAIRVTYNVRRLLLLRESDGEIILVDPATHNQVCRLHD